MRVLGLVGLLGLVGCPAAVTAEGMDDGFGLGLSAAWIHVDDGKNESDGIFIANYLDVCTKTQTWYQASVDVQEPALDILSNNYCKNLEEPFLAYAAASGELQFEGANVTSLSFSGSLNDKEYDFDDDVAGFVARVTDSPWQDAADDFDPDGDITDGCGVGTLDDDVGDNWTLVDGSVDVTALTDETSATGTVDARMQEGGSKGDKSDFTASFNAAWCEVNL